MKLNHFPKLKNIFSLHCACLLRFQFNSVDLFAQHLLFWRRKFLFLFSSLLDTKTSRDTFTNISSSLVCIVVHLLFFSITWDVFRILFFLLLASPFQSFLTLYFFSSHFYHSTGSRGETVEIATVHLLWRFPQSTLVFLLCIENAWAEIF